MLAIIQFNSLLKEALKTTKYKFSITYSSISLGKSKLITDLTFGMSRPRAATAVATRIGVLPTANQNINIENGYRTDRNHRHAHNDYLTLQ